MPSTKIRGALLAFKDLSPRIVKLKSAPALPEEAVKSNPATFPCKASKAFVVGIAVISRDFTEDIAPERSLFFCTP